MRISKIANRRKTHNVNRIISTQPVSTSEFTIQAKISDFEQEKRVISLCGHS